MKEIRRNITLLLIIMAAAFAVLAVYCLWMVRAHGESWRASSYNPRLNRQRSVAVAGDILDRTGRAMAAVDEDGQRAYPLGTGAVCHVVGDPLGFCAAGAETLYGPLLWGLDETDEERFLRYLRGGAPQGRDVELTVDAALQQAAADAMGDYQGAAVVLDYTTGEMLCMVSRPGFDPAVAADLAGMPDDEAAPLVNRVLQGQYAPGSIFKVVTAAAALEAGMDPLDRVTDCTGALEVDDGSILCDDGKGHGELNMYEAFARSCNSYFGQLGIDVGVEALRVQAQRMGFNREFTIEGLMLYGSRFTLSAGDGTGDIARAAIGQHEDLVTPLHMAMVAAAVANGGVMMEPALLLATGYDGAMEDVFSPRVWGRVMSEDTAGILAEMMRLCVAEGTGTRAAVDGVTVAGKTGTAQVSESEQGQPHGWFIGFIMDEGHPLCVAVVLEHAGYGGSTAAPAAARILEKAIALGY